VSPARLTPDPRASIIGLQPTPIPGACDRSGGTTPGDNERRSQMRALKVTFGRLVLVAAAIAYLVIEAAPRARYL